MNGEYMVVNIGELMVNDVLGVLTVVNHHGQWCLISYSNGQKWRVKVISVVSDKLSAWLRMLERLIDDG